MTHMLDRCQCKKCQFDQSVETDDEDIKYALEEGVDYSMLARYAWLRAKSPANISVGQNLEMHRLWRVVIPGINFPDETVEQYEEAAYKAFRSGYTWEDWRAELENQDFLLFKL